MDEYQSQIEDIRSQIQHLQHMAGALAHQESKTERRLESLRNKNGDLSQMETTEHGAYDMANQLLETCDLMNQHLDNIANAANRTDNRLQ